MNYLAHLLLAGKNKEVIYGGLLEDFMHGRVDHPRNNHLSQNIKIGLRLHREIDTLTDSHEYVKECKSVFYEDFGHYSSIVVDVLFDHFLIKNWQEFSDEDFLLFRKRMYETLGEFQDVMPEEYKKLYKSMLKHDWLMAYEFDYGLEKAFLSLNRRIKNGPDLTLSIALMHENYELLNTSFLAFFRVLKKHCDDFLINKM